MRGSSCEYFRQPSPDMCLAVGVRAIQGAVICALPILRRPLAKHFGRLLADYPCNLINLNRVSVTSLGAPVQFTGIRNDCAGYELTGDGFDTVGVWGSNPHAPTIFIDLFRYFCPPFIVHGTSLADFWQTLKNCHHTRFPLQKGFGRLQAAKVWTEVFLVNCTFDSHCFGPLSRMRLVAIINGLFYRWLSRIVSGLMR
jgi:hypothetical protein